MKQIFLIYGHYNDKSFNAAIRDTFIKSSEDKGNKVDCVDLYKEKFNPIFAGEEPDSTVLDHRKRIEKSDVIVLVAPIWNFRMPAMVEGWIDKVLSPPWAFSFKKLFGNYGYPIGNLKGKKAVVFCTYGSPQFATKLWFFNLPIRRIKRGCFNVLGFKKTNFYPFFQVPFVEKNKRLKMLNKVYKIGLKL